MSELSRGEPAESRVGGLGTGLRRLGRASLVALSALPLASGTAAVADESIPKVGEGTVTFSVGCVPEAEATLIGESGKAMYHGPVLAFACIGLSGAINFRYGTCPSEGEGGSKWFAVEVSSLGFRLAESGQPYDPVVTAIDSRGALAWTFNSLSNLTDVKVTPC